MAIRKPIFVVPMDLGAVVCGSARGGHAVSYLGRHNAPGLTWKTNGPSNVWARGQLPAAQDIDFCAVISANALPDTQIQLRLGASQAEVDGTAPYDSGAVDFIDPAIVSADGLYHSHLELDAPESASWWRIDVTGHTGDFEAAALVIGSTIEPSHFYNYDFEQAPEDLGELNIGRWGVFDETPGQIWRSLNFTLDWQSEAELEASFRPMVQRLGKRGVLYLCFDPEPTIYRQARTYLGVMRKPPTAKGMRKPKVYGQDWQLISMI